VEVPFAESLPVAEASGAVLMVVDGADALVVVGDSGRNGAYVIVDPEDGSVRESGALPLGDRGDDLEGLAVRDGALVALTSSGMVRVWRREARAWALADGPYAIADAASGLACPSGPVNCGKNYEGVCLRSGPVPDGECVGLAAAKTDGALYCLAEKAGRLVATGASIAVTGGEVLTGCDIAPDGAVWAGANLIGGSKVFRVTGWASPDGRVVEEVGAYGPGFPEAIAVGAGDGAESIVMYRFSDMGGAPSAVAKFACRAR
jgi:hypothetical protein